MSRHAAARLVFGLLLATAWACNDDAGGGPDREGHIPAGPATEGPEERGSFLDEPAGVPPDPFPPAMMELWVRASTGEEATRAALLAFGEARVVDVKAAGDAFVQRRKLWYAPLDELKLLARARAAGTSDPPALHPAPPRIALPLTPRWVVRTFGPKVANRDHIEAVRKSGARGYLVLWYPIAAVRERLIDGGRTGVWRGIIRFRDQLPGKAKLGGTPVLLLGAVAKIDRPALGDGPPPAIKALVGVDTWLGDPAQRSARTALVGQLGGSAPVASELPAAWRGLFQGPKGIDVVFMIPKQDNMMDGALDRLIEGLVPAVREGTQAWLVVGLPLAQKFKKRRH